MMEIFIDSNVDRIFKEFDDTYLKQVPFAASLAINRVAYTIAKKRLPMETQRVFDRGSERWTKQGFEYTKATKRNLIAVVRVRDQQDYLNLQIAGGVLRPKAGKGLVQKTKHSRLTKPGNISRKMRANYIKRKSLDNFFVGTPKGFNPDTDYGVWQRLKGGRLKMHMQIIRDPVRYRKKFKFYKFAKSQFYKDFDWQFAKALVGSKN